VPDGVLRVTKLFAAPTAITGGGLDHPFAAALAGWGIGGSWHGELLGFQIVDFRTVSLTAMAERHHVRDMVRVRFADRFGVAQAPFVLRGLVCVQMPLARTVAHHFTGRRDLESFRGALFCLG
jgi:hypothetical protein